MVIPVDSSQPKEAAVVPTKTNAKCEASDESEYSSLEDDDDVQGNALNKQFVEKYYLKFWISVDR